MAPSTPPRPHRERRDWSEPPGSWIDAIPTCGELHPEGLGDCLKVRAHEGVHDAGDGNTWPNTAEAGG